MILKFKEVNPACSALRNLDEICLSGEDDEILRERGEERQGGKGRSEAMKVCLIK